MQKEKLIELSKTIKITPKQKVIDSLDDLEHKLRNHIDLIEKFETDAEPMVRVDDQPISFLREDTPGETLNKEDILKNAPQTEGDFIVVPKGGNDD